MRHWILTLLFIAFILPLSAQTKRPIKKTEPVPVEKPTTGKVWGTTYFDYSYNVENPTASLKGENGFNFRRIYLGYDQDLTDQFSARILFEANYSDLTVLGSQGPFVKNAYLEWKQLLPLSSFFLGMSGTPSVALSEKIWGYRSLEKVMLDRLGLVSAADMGIAVKGKFDGAGTITYHAMVGNGRGTKTENNKLKKFIASFGIIPAKGFLIELYGDFENQSMARSIITAKGLLGLDFGSGCIGLEGFYRMEKKTGVDIVTLLPVDQTPLGMSGFIWLQIAAPLRVVLRGDYFDPDFEIKSVGAQHIYALAGLDYLPGKDIHLIPNIMYEHQLNKNSAAAAVKDAITARLTVAYTFSHQFE